MDAPRKRPRALQDNAELATAPGSPSCANNMLSSTRAIQADSCSQKQTSRLLALPEELILLVLSFLDARSLGRVRALCSLFSSDRGGATASGAAARNHRLSLPDKAARHHMLRKYLHCPGEADRWRYYTWLQRQLIDEVETPFDIERSRAAGVTFFSNMTGATDEASSERVDSNGDSVKVSAGASAERSVRRLRLDGIGPKMLVSAHTTHSAPFLHWRLQLRGNNAVELGVVPEALQDSHKALHKCQATASSERPTGMCSAITVGSLLPVRVPLMKGSDVEVLASRTRLEFLIKQPQDGYEMTWINSVTVPRLYTGPRTMRVELDLDLKCPAKLALTCWAHADFVVVPVINPRPLPPLAPPPQQPAQQPNQQQQAAAAPDPELQQFVAAVAAAAAAAQIQPNP